MRFVRSRGWTRDKKERCTRANFRTSWQGSEEKTSSQSSGGSSPSVVVVTIMDRVGWVDPNNRMQCCAAHGFRSLLLLRGYHHGQHGSITVICTGAIEKDYNPVYFCRKSSMSNQSIAPTPRTDGISPAVISEAALAPGECLRSSLKAPRSIRTIVKYFNPHWLASCQDKMKPKI